MPRYICITKCHYTPDWKKRKMISKEINEGKPSPEKLKELKKEFEATSKPKLYAKGEYAVFENDKEAGSHFQLVKSPRDEMAAKKEKGSVDPANARLLRKEINTIKAKIKQYEGKSMSPGMMAKKEALEEQLLTLQRMGPAPEGSETIEFEDGMDDADKDMPEPEENPSDEEKDEDTPPDPNVISENKNAWT